MYLIQPSPQADGRCDYWGKPNEPLSVTTFTCHPLRGFGDPIDGVAAWTRRRSAQFGLQAGGEILVIRSLQSRLDPGADQWPMSFRSRHRKPMPDSHTCLS